MLGLLIGLLAGYRAIWSEWFTEHHGGIWLLYGLLKTLIFRHILSVYIASWCNFFDIFSAECGYIALEQVCELSLRSLEKLSAGACYGLRQKEQGVLAGDELFAEIDDHVLVETHTVREQVEVESVL